MKPARIPWEQLRDIVDANRIKHFEAFMTATEGWMRETKAALEEQVLFFDDAISGMTEGVPDQPKFDPKPVSHIADYERLLKMIDLTDESHIELDEREFDQYVNDEWHWKREFVLSNSKYGAFD